MQVESDIAPFKDLLMGLFFMTVGMEISFGLFVGKFKEVIGALALLVIGKVSSVDGTLTPVNHVLLLRVFQMAKCCITVQKSWSCSGKASSLHFRGR